MFTPSMRIMSLAFLLMAMLLPSGVIGGEGSAPRTALENAFKIESGSEAGSLAHQLVMTFMSNAQWRKHVEKVRENYRRWHVQHDEDVGRYLNDQLSGIVMSATRGKVEKLKDGAVWIALYKEFEQPLPALVSDFVEQHKASINGLLAKFSWEAASVYVKRRQWKKDGAKSDD
jgi:hypothetical protein